LAKLPIQVLFAAIRKESVKKTINVLNDIDGEIALVA
jgi:hypothetical protein